MSERPVAVIEEQQVLDRVIPCLRSIQSEDGERDRELTTRVRELHRQWTDARGDPAQREAFEEALDEARRALTSHQNARRARELPVGTPYFAQIGRAHV